MPGFIKTVVPRWVAPLWPVALSFSVAVIFCAVAATMLVDMRHNARRQAEEGARNLVNVIQQDIARNADVIALSLGSLVDAVTRTDLDTVTPELRQLVLFDRFATAKSLGSLVTFDEKGELHFDSAGVQPRQIQAVTDRDYFQAQIARDVGLFISAPYQSRLLGAEVVGFSRRIEKPDGSFGGVALATIRLSYFTDLFRRLNVGKGGVITLIRTDGIVLAREPVVMAGTLRNISTSTVFQTIVQRREGSLVRESQFDQRERLYTFSTLPGLPLIVSVALATDDIYAEWWGKALALGAILFTVSLATVGLTFFLMRELQRRGMAEQSLRAANSELARLSVTDALTGLANRRRFDEVLISEARRAKRLGRPLTLLLVDADSFKNFNDRYGHSAGDEALKLVARCLESAVKRPSDLPCRIGGEEFAIVLPDTAIDGGIIVGDKLRTLIQGRRLLHEGTESGVLTVSVGAASLQAGQDIAQLFARADAALYEAKRQGRNRVCTAEPVLAVAGRAA